MPGQLGCVFLVPESSPGTAIAVNGANAMAYSSLDVAYQGSAIRRSLVKPENQGSRPAPPGSWYAELSGDIEVKAAASAGALPEIDTILQCGGFEDTVDAGVSVTYTMYDAPNAAATDYAATAYLEEKSGGNSYQYFGCRADQLVFKYDPSTGLRLAHRLVGGVGTFTASPATAPTFNAGLPFVALDDTTPYTICGHEAVLRSLEISIPLQVELRPDGSAAASTGHYAWPGWVHMVGDPTIKVVAEMPLQSTKDFIAAWKAGTETTTDAVKFTAGSRTLTIDFPSTVLDVPSIEWGPPTLVTLTGIISGDLSLVFA